MTEPEATPAPSLEPYKAAVRKAYDDAAVKYDADNRDYTDRHLAKVFRQFVADVKAAGGRRVLDLGSGAGHDAARLQRAGFETLAIDLSEPMVELTRAKGVPALVMDYIDLRLPDASFDGVWSARALQHVPKAVLPAVLRRVREVLTAEGRFYLVVFQGEGEGPLSDTSGYYSASRYFAYYSVAELRELLRAAGFDVHQEWRLRLRRRGDTLLALAATPTSEVPTKT
jgi:ubiquinone/menaquinone biosynthesis C-methylase UbiE